MAKKDTPQKEGEKKRGRPPLSPEDKLARVDIVRSERLSVALSAIEKQQVEELRKLLGLKSASSTFNSAVAYTLKHKKRESIVKSWKEELQTMALITASEFSEWRAGQQTSRTLRDFLREKLQTGKRALFCLEIPLDRQDVAIRRLSYEGSTVYDAAIDSYCQSELSKQEALATSLDSKGVPYKTTDGTIVTGWKSPYPAGLCYAFFCLGQAAREVDVEEALAADSSVYCYADSISLAPRSFTQAPTDVGSKEKDS